MEVVLLFALIIGLMLIGVPISVALGLSSISFLLLYSDGFTEAVLKDGRMLDQEGLRKLVVQCGAARGTEFLDDLYWRLSQITRAGTSLEDDVSAALVEFDGVQG